MELIAFCTDSHILTQEISVEQFNKRLHIAYQRDHFRAKGFDFLSIPCFVCLSQLCRQFRFDRENFRKQAVLLENVLICATVYACIFFCKPCIRLTNPVGEQQMKIPKQYIRIQSTKRSISLYLTISLERVV